MATLYDEIGGASVIKTAVSVFYQRVVADPSLAPWFAGVDLDRLRAHQRAFLMVTLGGPDLFTGRELTEAHAGLRVTDAAFDALVSHLSTTLLDLGVAQATVAKVGRRLGSLRDAVVQEHPGGHGAGVAPGADGGADGGPGTDGTDAAVMPARGAPPAAPSAR